MTTSTAAAMQLLEQDLLVHSFVFAAWDNVVGPKILRIWPGRSFVRSEELPSFDVVDEVGIEISEEKVINSVSGDEDGNETQEQKNSVIQIDDEQVAKYISIHTLTGHLAKSKHTDYDGVNDISLNVPALGFISQSATFYCLLFSNSDGYSSNGFVEEPCMGSLTLVFHCPVASKVFWDIQPLVIHLLQKTAEKLKVGLSQDSNYHEEPIVGKWLSEIYNTVMDTSNLCIRPGLASPIQVKKMLNVSQISWDIVITSMLTTMGSCCVVGTNEDFINRVIDLLIIFLPEAQQLTCSRYAANDFTGGLYLQGLVEDANGVRNINSSDILLNEFPLTMLDLSRKSKAVKFSGYGHEHYRSKQRQSREQEFNLIQRRPPDIPFTTESVFRPFTDSSRYVRWCLEQLQTHNTEHWTRIISAFHQALALQAADVIKAFQSRNFANGDGLKSMKNSLKKSMKITESDFWLLVATGERLKPGFCRIFVNYRVL